MDLLDTGTVGKLPEASFLISEFQEVDRKLTQALEGDDINLIKAIGDEADLLIEQMINCRCECKTEKKVLMRFLIERFVLEGNQEDGLKQKVCERLLSEILV